MGSQRDDTRMLPSLLFQQWAIVQEHATYILYMIGFYPTWNSLLALHKGVFWALVDTELLRIVASFEADVGRFLGMEIRV